MTRRLPPPARLRGLVAAGIIGTVLTGTALAGCAATGSVSTTSSVVDAASAADVALDGAALWDATTVHSIAVEVDDATLRSAIDTYLASGEKVWIEATVVIDGVRFERVGLKLKGNSSLRSLTADTDPATLPWLLRLDKFVDGQTWDGWSELVVRGNSSATSMNEAVALGLLSATGLASEAAVASGFSINGGDTQLRLVVQNPDDQWASTALADDTLLYKAESGGTWDYVGDDPADYVGDFEQEAGDDDLTPLIDFLEFVNESDDATFAADLDQWLDVDAFATYLAFQNLVQNSDDIDGPGNNAYLAADAATGRMTVVNWDLNLAFGASPDGGMGTGMGAGGGMAGPPAGGQGGAPGAVQGGAPAGAPTGGGMAGGGATGAATGGAGAMGATPSQGNVLAERFLATDAFAALVDAASARLQTELVDSGVAAGILAQWTATLTEHAGDLVSAETVASEAASIAAKLGIE